MPAAASDQRLAIVHTGWLWSSPMNLRRLLDAAANRIAAFRDGIRDRGVHEPVGVLSRDGVHAPFQLVQDHQAGPGQEVAFSAQLCDRMLQRLDELPRPVWHLRS